MRGGGGGGGIKVASLLRLNCPLDKSKSSKRHCKKKKMLKILMILSSNEILCFNITDK